MKEPDGFPRVVIQAIERWAARHQQPLSIDEIRWDSMNGCWFFTRNGMYHGVEVDGHIHT